VLATVYAACGAAAAEPGVHVDPNSPPGKEYALPLESARSDAAGGTATRGTTTAPSPNGGSGGEASGANAATTPLFGEGITRPRAHPAAPIDRGGRRSKTSLAPIRPDKTSGDFGTSGSGWLWSLGAGALVITAGAALGVGFRRSARPNA
jgi:hypothetical protein